MSDDAVKFFISKFRGLLDNVPELPTYYRPRPYKNAAVQFKISTPEDFEERRRIVEKTGLNVFFFPAHHIPGCDLLSDSGTTTMTMTQWSQLLLGDEAYGSNEGFFHLKTQMVETFGPSWNQTREHTETLFLFHQGRAAENALFSVFSRMLHKGGSVSPLFSDSLESSLRNTIEEKLSAFPPSERPYFIIPSNSHFDTTEANIGNNNILPLNLPCNEHVHNDEAFSFRGNMNTNALRNLLENEHHRVPLIYLTITNNTGGGQPASMSNIKEVSEIAGEYDIPFFLDACRFAENAWFVQQKESQYQNKSIQDIVWEMFEYADGFHISFKKDGLVNIGGALVIKEGGRMARKHPDLQNRLTDYQILTEGHPTYGGMAGRDLKGLVQGLKTVVNQKYLDHRIRRVEKFGRKLEAYHIPVIKPVGGHAVYMNMDRFFEGTETKDHEFKGIAFTALMLIAGHRLCELGVYAFGKYKNGKEYPPDPRVNFVRGAVPRLMYEDQDLFSAAEAAKVLYDNRDRIPGVEVVYGRDLTLRHFKSRFRFKI
ncbi:tryptophanase [Desulfonema magnum]|uniref:Lyase domain-containing protein n=1 Tax=Desulfonema magnum TaxID=45655 RepID=A0A975BVH2_9BACT|nr:tryptophanase [Desulfonema magnum]QTA92506.1 Lyase domain-containing protein [Desulfonema magnum]